jgi:AraC-like DNA-binding protein
LKWHLLVLWYLNDHLDQDAFEDLASFISDKENGFVTFNVSPQLLEKIIYDVSIQDLERPPKNKIRKIIFRDNSGLTTKEKLAIVGQMVGKRKLSETEIYDAMLMLHDEGEKITIAKLADNLGCSTRTVHRNMGVELKKEKQLLNQEL